VLDSIRVFVEREWFMQKAGAEVQKFEVVVGMVVLRYTLRYRSSFERR
jgi:hypothetical protein